MPRFNLREFSTPAYAPYIPEAPVEERPAQKVADLLYFMHTLPWFSESEEEDDDVDSYNENMENSQAQRDEHEDTMRESVKTHEDKKMDGYEPTDFDYDTAATLYNEDPNNVTRNPSEVEQKERIDSNPLGSRAGGDRGVNEHPFLPEYREKVRQEALQELMNDPKASANPMGRKKGGYMDNGTEDTSGAAGNMEEALADAARKRMEGYAPVYRR